MKKKNFVLDTNILLHDPNCLGKFEENDIYLSCVAIEELDGLRKSAGETGFSAREASRKINEFRKRGNLLDGVDTEGGGKVFVIPPANYTAADLPGGWSINKPDNRILADVLRMSQTTDVILVSNDANMQIKAEALGLKVQEYKNDKISDETNLYKGRSTRYLSDADFNTFVAEKAILATHVMDDGTDQPPLTINEFVVAKPASGNGSVLAKFDGIYLKMLEHKAERPSGLKTRNAGQIFLQEALLSDLPLAICVGSAGTAKTLFAVGCGLEQVMEQHKYKRVLLCRPNIMMDEEIGHLPGTEQEKISPLHRGAYDNLEIILGHKSDTHEELQDKILEVFQRGYIKTESLAYLRGRSIPDTIIVIDEAQNCTPNQALSIITRCGERSKIVLIGDPNQIDHPRLDKRNNGLVFALEKMKGSKLCEIMTFDESECTRSALAKEASDRLRVGNAQKN